MTAAQLGVSVKEQLSVEAYLRAGEACSPSATCSKAAARAPSCGLPLDAYSSGNVLPDLYHLISSWTADV